MENIEYEKSVTNDQDELPVAYLYTLSTTGKKVLTMEKQKWADSGSGLWIETPLFKRDS